MARQRLGVLGGTFDPIHLGHLVVASEVAHLLALDAVLFVPTGEPWQKAGAPITDAETRYEMTVRATRDDPRFRASRVDIDRPGVTYTRDTLRDLRDENPDADLYFIVGADAIASLPTWRYVDELFALATFVGVGRPGYAADVAAFPDGAVTMVETPLVDVSASGCRARVARGAPLRYLTPDAVVDFIAERRLYAGSA